MNIRHPQTPRGTANTGWIPEIQGLRTLSLLLIVVFHLWVGRVSGGVDVFFLVSSYLLTRQFIRRFERDELLTPLLTTLRRFARLLPLAAAAITLILISTWILLPHSSWSAAHWDALASLFYVENWRLMSLSADYYAGNHAAQSLFQHFWSLSVQGQVFILWPLLHYFTGRYARRTQRDVRRALLVVFAVVFALSLAWSIVFTAANQQLAYFDTGARLWEFAAGSILAIVHPKLRDLQANARAALGWVGIALLISCGIVLPVSSTFPGFVALWPVAAGALIILSSGEPTRIGPDRILASKPLAFIAGYTYALYLIHWPVLVTYLKLTEHQHATALDGTIIFAIAAGVSIAITHLVERPVSRFLAGERTGKPAHADTPAGTDQPASTDTEPNANKPARPRATANILFVTASCLVLVGGMIATAEAQRALNSDQAQDAADSALGGTAVTQTDGAKDRSPGWDPVAMEYGAEAPDKPTIDDPLPGAAAIESQYSGEGEDCSEYIVSEQTDGICFETAPPSTEKPRVLFVGNSHTQQFAAIGYATREVSQQLEVRVQAGPGCPFYRGDDRADDACGATWRAAADYVRNTKPEYVVVLGTQSQFDAPDEPMDGVPEWISALRTDSPDTEFIVLRDSPRLAPPPYECGATHGWDADQCRWPAPKGPSRSFVNSIRKAGGHWVDLTDYICPKGVCRPQVGQVAVWFDENHISDAYSRTLAQHFADAITSDVPDWPAEVYARADQTASTTDP